MKERPIIFSTPMVRAIREDRKSQTRRVIKIQPPEDSGTIIVGNYHPTIIDSHGDEQPGPEVFGAHGEEWSLAAPYGVPGDRLWVRETWTHAWNPPKQGEEVFYRADGEVTPDFEPWKPSIFMPRWASRITLEITAVRVERLQEITRGDCMAEGCPFPNIAKTTDPRGWFSDLWQSINGPGSWEINPWVWVIGFRVITP